MIWFTSDTHFGSERTLQLSKRPFKSVSRMNTEIVDNWNELVSPEDTVYHLGDFGDYKYLDQLEGKIIFIKGNYDEKDNLEGLFSDVLDECYLELPSGESIFLNHYPSKHSQDKFNLFGHVHKLCMIKKYGLNVGVDCHDFKPINLETVLFYKNGIENHYDSEVFY